MKKIIFICLLIITVNLYGNDLIGTWHTEFTSNDFKEYYGYELIFYNNGIFEYKDKFSPLDNYTNRYRGNYNIRNNNIIFQVTHAYHSNNWLVLNNFLVVIREDIFTSYYLTNETMESLFNMYLRLLNQTIHEYKLNNRTLELIINGNYALFYSLNNSLIFTKK